MLIYMLILAENYRLSKGFIFLSIVGNLIFKNN